MRGASLLALSLFGAIGLAAASAAELQRAQAGRSERGPSLEACAQRTIHRGVPSLIDADTLDVDGCRLRLFGIDAMEAHQTCRRNRRVWACGEAAIAALDALIAGRAIVCETVQRDRFRRILARCRVGRVDINAWLVREGWALADRAYSTDFVVEEALAERERKGVWAGSFIPPWEWRQGR